MEWFPTAAADLPAHSLAFLAIALLVAFAFEFINGFHDTANAVTTVIYTQTMRPTPAVIYSGLCNFLGVLLGGTAVAFSIVNLLPVDLLVNAESGTALAMVLSLLVAGVIWNLATWLAGLPVSSSHTLIGAVLGVGLAHGLWSGRGFSGVEWRKTEEVGLALLLSPLLGFAAAGGLLLAMKRLIREPRLYHPPGEGDEPPRWVRGVLVTTCGGVSFAHGANDGQKGMGLVLLVLIGFMPAHYALNTNRPGEAKKVAAAVGEVRAAYEAAGRPLPDDLAKELGEVAAALEGKDSFHELANEPRARWELRQSIFLAGRALDTATAEEAASPEFRRALEKPRGAFGDAIEFVPTWVKVMTALALGLGTMVGYKRIVVTVAEKIGKTHLTYAQGAAAESVAAATILLAVGVHLPVSTTHVLSSGVAGTMVANGSGVQMATIRKIALAWVFTLPCSLLLAAGLFSLARLIGG